MRISRPFSKLLSLLPVFLLTVIFLGPHACRGDGFSPGASLTTARYGHTSTLLPNGKVLIVGGESAWESYFSVAEIYDPSTGTLAQTGSLARPRSYHTATLLPNGKVLITGGLAPKDTAWSSAELYDPRSGRFSDTGEMGVPRASHTATLLQNGKVLIVGGYAPGSFQNSAEIFDPSTGSFTPAASPLYPHNTHTATLLTDGTVLVVGGSSNTGDLHTAELYQPALDQFSPAGPLSQGRGAHTATRLPDGKVLIAGGYDRSGAMAGAEIYDPVARQFSPTDLPLHQARGYHSATLLPGGQVLIVGGHTASGPGPSVEIYNPATRRFSLLAARLLEGRTLHSATLLPGGTVFVAGGAGADSTVLAGSEIYDPALGYFGSLWVNGSFTARYAHTVTLLPDGKFLLAGGRDANDNYLSSAQLFDPAGGGYRDTGSLSAPRAYHTATLLANGKVLVVGGSNGECLAGAEIYDPDTGSFSPAADLATKRNHHSAVLLFDGSVLVAGGSDCGGQVVPTAERYTPGTNSFSPAGSLLTPRLQHTATLLTDGRVLIAGGHQYGIPVAGLEIFDPASSDFHSAGNLVPARYQHSATLLENGKVLIAAGIDADFLDLSDAQIFDPTQRSLRPAGSLTTPRHAHSATLLPSGKVLVAGGSSWTDFDGRAAEFYDPATNGFSAAGSLNVGRYYHRAALGVTGWVFFFGGIQNFSLATEATEAYLEPYGRIPATITAAALNQSCSLTLAGTGFRGDSEASSGGTRDSSTGFPLLRLRSIDSEQTRFVPSLQTASWTDGSFLSESLAGAATGNYLASIVTDGIPSTAKIITLAAEIDATPRSWDFGPVLRGGVPASHSFVVTNRGPADLVLSAISAGEGFTVGAGDCGALPVRLAAFASCALTAAFAPGFTGPATAQFRITSNAPGLPVLSIDLSGTGVSAPQPPSEVTAVGGNGQATVSFTPDAASGSCDFTVVSSPGGLTATGAASPITVKGLTNGVPYTFTVTATSQTGTSAPSAASNAVVPAPASLSVSIGGLGSGSVKSTPPGIDCGTESSEKCTASFGAVSVTLTPSADWTSTFAGWDGACSGLGPCTVSLESNNSVSARFDPNLVVKLVPPGTTFATLQQAYALADSGSRILARSYLFRERLVLDQAVTVTLEGGKDTAFGQTLAMTKIQGGLVIRRGTLKARNLSI